ENPSEAVDLFKPFVPEKDVKIDLRKALDISNPAFGKEWGSMSEMTISGFLNWVYQNNLESVPLEVSDIITDEIL
ncbi:MAG: hypothetical protein ACI9D1_002549, partial [Cryomorphaceae bacterium]